MSGELGPVHGKNADHDQSAFGLVDFRVNKLNDAIVPSKTFEQLNFVAKAGVGFEVAFAELDFFKGKDVVLAVSDAIHSGAAALAKQSGTKVLLLIDDDVGCLADGARGGRGGGRL